VLWYLFPFFLNIASTSIKATVGLDVPSPVAALIWTLIFTAAFNILHILLSIIPSYIVVKMISKAGITKLWITEIAKETDC
jgi:predicted membrane protein